MSPSPASFGRHDKNRATDAGRASEYTSGLHPLSCVPSRTDHVSFCAIRRRRWLILDMSACKEYGNSSSTYHGKLGMEVGMTRGGCGQEKRQMSLAQDGKREKVMSYLTSQSSRIQTDVPSNFTDHCNLVPYWNQETPIPDR